MIGSGGGVISEVREARVIRDQGDQGVVMIWVIRMSEEISV